MKRTILILVLGLACKPSSQIGELVGTQNKITTLDNTSWILVELDGQAIHTDIKRPTLLFKNENKAGGFSGCNSYSGTYTKKGNHQLSFNGLISTKMFCESSKDLEPGFLNMLSETDSFELIGNQLVLYSNKKIRARFTAMDNKSEMH